jgi:hypothetical protein
MGSEVPHLDTHVEHPLWALFLRWCAIRPKLVDKNFEHLTPESRGQCSRLESLPDYAYSPLKDPGRDARLLELLPAHFDEGVRIRIHHVTLVPPPEGGQWRLTLAEVRSNLPKGWEAFQTVSKQNLLSHFRNVDFDTSISWSTVDISFAI